MVHVFAYVDPGSGSMLIQASVAALSAVAVAPVLARRRISAFLHRKRRDESTPTTTTTTTTTTIAGKRSENTPRS